jgi:hypothetical protein
MDDATELSRLLYRRLNLRQSTTAFYALDYEAERESAWLPAMRPQGSDLQFQASSAAWQRLPLAFKCRIIPERMR